VTGLAAGTADVRIFADGIQSFAAEVSAEASLPRRAAVPRADLGRAHAHPFDTEFIRVWAGAVAQSAAAVRVPAIRVPAIGDAYAHAVYTLFTRFRTGAVAEAAADVRVSAVLPVAIRGAQAHAVYTMFVRVRAGAVAKALASVRVAAVCTGAIRRADALTHDAFVVGRAFAAAAGVDALSVHARPSRLAHHPVAEILDALAVHADLVIGALHLVAGTRWHAAHVAGIAVRADPLTGMQPEAGTVEAELTVCAGHAQAGAGREAALDALTLHAGGVHLALDPFAGVFRGDARHEAALVLLAGSRVTGIGNTLPLEQHLARLAYGTLIPSAVAPVVCPDGPVGLFLHAGTTIAEVISVRIAAREQGQ
jgi:hypothetical protein